jgi:adenosine deaminase
MAVPTLAEIRKLPKADLHSHIDGSIPPAVLFKIAKRNHRKVMTPKGTELDSASAFLGFLEEGGYDSLLDHIVERFFPITGMMQTEEVLREVGTEYLLYQKSTGVTYCEGRFAPQYHTREGLTYEQVIRAMHEGLREGSETHGVDANLIVAFGRESDPGTAEQVARAAGSSRLAVAFDIGGPEIRNPATKFANAFRIAGGAGIKLVAHAGEGAGSVAENLRNIRYAVEELGVSRVGHAIDLAKDARLVEEVVAKSVTVETNPVSNMALKYATSSLDISIDRLLAAGVRATVNSDDPALWPDGDVSSALALVCSEYSFGMAELGRLVLGSFEGSFASPERKASYAEDYRRAAGLTG